MASFELRGVGKRFGGVRALDNIDIRFESGRVHALLGENGAGKSTLIKILTGAIMPTTGEIRVDEATVVIDTPRRAQELGIAAVYQEPTVYPHMTVLENLFMGQELRGTAGMLDKRAMIAAATPLLERLRLEPSILARRMSSLSIGYQQLVLITQALLRDTRLLIFDEPTSILSREETARLFQIIGELREAGTAIVYITHRMEEIHQIADEVTVLTNGQRRGTYPIDEISTEQMLSLMTGGHGSARDRDIPPAEAGTERPPMLEVEHLTVDGYCEDISWQLPAGCVTGLYGLVGSGRSETALAIYGHTQPSAGTIKLDGETIRPRHPAQAIQLGLGYLPEDRQFQGVFLDKSLEQNLTSNALPGFSKAFDLLDLAGMRRFTTDLMKRYNIKAPDADTPIGALSGGNQQKGLFSRWANLPLKALILDEPTRGIDIGAKEEIHRFVRHLADRGMAVGVISSDLDEVLAVSDRIIVMREGHIADTFEHGPFSAETVLAAAIGSSSSADGRRAQTAEENA
ncbi:sugar ABC transporter ATP-binding protein [Salinisphaera hydrothermalis]|uniref:ABC transporter ATP-binding protein n=1 Tax=Salinisphaera hydrothermalis (strain C41B8) TaxID=1304275 RepID=A0A084IPR8_SALHC|nr:sugar ABC transporter ATP-binding protein [Salinisphaera hydrothermalis]KEZ78702.1 ABC transporter ATP-binding protein [Salinisphaera hydrothermalis C41B8]